MGENSAGAITVSPRSPFVVFPLLRLNTNPLFSFSSRRCHPDAVTVPETFRCCSRSQSTLSFSCCSDGLTRRGLAAAAWRRSRLTHARERRRGGAQLKLEHVWDTGTDLRSGMNAHSRSVLFGRQCCLWYREPQHFFYYYLTDFILFFFIMSTMCGQRFIMGFSASANLVYPLYQGNAYFDFPPTPNILH